jgi:signal transduction histidine kinase
VLVGLRRKRALNEALHELRRPLQVLALAGAGSAGEDDDGEIGDSVRMAATALERLEREVNGGPVAVSRGPLAARPLVAASVSRLRRRVALAGKTLDLRWRAGDAVVSGELWELSRALDNLIDNAIAHGGPRIVVEAGRAGGMLRLAVVDSGRPLSGAGRGTASLLPARRRGARRRGHGLRIVRRAAAANGGGFELRLSAGGATAVLELPLLGEESAR